MKYKNTYRYAFIGTVFGLSFPFIATFIETFSSNLSLTFNNSVLVQGENPLLWIIDTAPLFLGIFAGLAGIRQDRLAQQYTQLEAEILARKKAFQELEKLKNKLDQDVRDRTWALETSTEVGRRLSTIIDQNELVREVVEQIQEAFNYYHVQIYFFDESKEKLVMVGGTGTPGRILVEHGHKISKGQGLVGRAGDTNLPVWEFDVYQSKTWIPNPLLPDTKSEAAIPIAIGHDVVGVLDVQDNKFNSLTEADVELLQSIANQVANAIQNAQTYQRTQEQVNRETQMANINQQIQNTTNVEEALKVAVRELGRALGTSTCIYLSNGKSNS